MKKALITGGAKRLGKHITEWLAKNNYDVCITFNSSENNLKQITKKVKYFKRDFLSIKADFTKPECFEKVFCEFESKWGRIDLLINNAGIFPKQNIFDISEKNWEDVFNINLKSAFFLSQKFSKIMNNGGNIINISSIGAFEIWEDRILYNVSKSALVTLTKSLAKSLAPKIKVNSIAPGLIMMKDKSEKGNIISKEKIPLNRYGTVNDILLTIKYLIENKYVTGTTILVDGGKSLK